ncbi:MAG TPA: hypothetical protein VK696_10755 [Steroidobacteraceae bacterium]|jgi:hypothetical protein|nr:hypothetical protein [Steroidobacteraceae bacterium]
MMLSNLIAKIQAAGDVHSYAVYLAEPDRDGNDVDLATIGRVEVLTDSKEVRLYPSSTATDVDCVDPEPYLGMILDQLPTDSESDLRLSAEVPLLRGESDDTVSFKEVVDICIGRDAEEVWLLLRPASAFADGLMPT